MNFLDRLDNYFYSKKTSEVWIMVLLVSALVGYLLYTLISPISTNYREKQEGINKDLTHKINSANSFLRSITVNGDRDYKVKELNRKIVKKRVELNSYRAKLTKLNGAMKQLSGVLYTKDNWSKFLHNITVKAKQNNLKVNSITNVVLDQNGTTFGKVLDIGIECQGKYGEILSFMNDLEKTKLVANISSVKLTATQSEPKVDINLSVWGIKP